MTTTIADARPSPRRWWHGIPLTLLLAGGVLALATCCSSHDDAAGAGMLTTMLASPSPDAAPVAQPPPSTGPTLGGELRPYAGRDPVEVVRTFLDLPISSPPFFTPRDYFAFLRRRPGLLNFSVTAHPAVGTLWDVTVTLQSERGEQQTASCRFDPVALWPEDRVVPGQRLQFWRHCPGLFALWSAFAPTSIATIAAARVYVPGGRVALPEPEPPAGYQLTSVTLPVAGADAAAAMFTVRLTYEREGSDPVVVVEQLGQTGLPTSAAFSACWMGRWPADGACRAFPAKGLNVVVFSSAANAVVVGAFAHAIDARQAP